MVTGIHIHGFRMVNIKNKNKTVWFRRLVPTIRRNLQYPSVWMVLYDIYLLQLGSPRWQWSVNLHKYRKGTVQSSRKGKIEESSLYFCKPNNLFRETRHNLLLFSCFYYTKTETTLLGSSSLLLFTNCIFRVIYFFRRISFYIYASKSQFSNSL